MSDGFTAYERGLEGKEKQTQDKKAATTKAPAKVIQTPQEDYWIKGCKVFLRDKVPPIVYLAHSKISQSQSQDIQKAIAYVKKTTTGTALLQEFNQRKDELKIGVHFFAARADYPYTDVNPNESGHIFIASSTAVSPIIIFVTVFVGQRTPECIADTLFHELAHVWFLATQSGYSESLGTGHLPNAYITIDDNCKKTYTGYDPLYQKQVEDFDNALGKLPGAKRCCA